jgi:hypothetical protein
MRNTATIIILSVVATVLVIGIGVCITIKPFTAIGLAPILAAISMIIRAIRGQPTRPHEGTKHPTRRSSHTQMAGPTEQPHKEVAPQDIDFQDPVNATSDSIPVPREFMDIQRTIPDLPTVPADHQLAPDPQHGNRRRWPRSPRHRHRKSR